MNEQIIVEANKYRWKPKSCILAEKEIEVDPRKFVVDSDRFSTLKGIVYRLFLNSDDLDIEPEDGEEFEFPISEIASDPKFKSYPGFYIVAALNRQDFPWGEIIDWSYHESTEDATFAEVELFKKWSFDPLGARVI